jgi:hypothetical protein
VERDPAGEQAREVRLAGQAIVEPALGADLHHPIDQIIGRHVDGHRHHGLAERRQIQSLVGAAMGERLVVELEIEGHPVDLELEIVRIAQTEVDPELLLEQPGLAEAHAGEADLRRLDVGPQEAAAGGQQQCQRKADNETERPPFIAPMVAHQLPPPLPDVGA